MTVSIDPVEFAPIIRAAVAEAVGAVRDGAQNPASEQTEDPLLYDTKGAARLLGVTPRAISDWTARGLLTATKMGRLVRYHRTELERAANEGLAD